MSKYKMHILVCAGTGCNSSESSLVYEMLRDEVERKGLNSRYELSVHPC